MPKLLFTKEAADRLRELRADPGLSKRYKAVKGALDKMRANLRHPGLHTHEFHCRPCPHGGKLFEAYAQNRTPTAFRIYWCYAPPPPPDTIMIVQISEHP